MKRKVTEAASGRIERAQEVKEAQKTSRIQTLLIQKVGKNAEGAGDQIG